MKKKLGLLLPIISVMTLSGCDIFKAIIDMYYPDLETYFKENNYTDSSDVNNFNDVMGRHVYFWSKRIQTYTNSNNSSIVYDSPRGDHITHFENNKQITIYSRYAEKIVLIYKEGDTLPIRYSSEQGDNIRMKNDGKLYYVSDKSYLVEVDEEHSHILQVQQDDNGYLLVSHLNFMVYVSKDFTKFYINTENTATFTNYEGSVTVPESDLLTASLAKCQKRDNLFIPVPEDYTNHIYHKDYVDEDNPSEWLAYDVVFPLMKAVDYVSFLKEKGFEIYRGEYHELFSLDGENGGEWVVYDQNHEFDIHLQYQSTIALLKSNQPSYGVQLHVRRAAMTFSYYGLTVNEQTDWTDNEKKFMQETFGRELPFINLGRSYYVNKTKRKNGEMPFDSALDMDVECYWITDSFYKDVVTDKYGEILESNGFTKYIPPVTENSTFEEKKTWKYSEECKYYECYLDDEHDLAVKFLFDDISGNTIKIFKKSELIEWSHSLDESDKK